MSMANVVAGVRRRRIVFWPAMLALAWVLPFWAPPARAATYDVGVESYQYVPKDITIAQGDSVRWYWIFGTHTVTEGSDCVVNNPLFNSPSDPSHPVFIYQFNDTGLFNYFCELHCLTMNMKGSVTVLAPSSVPGGGPAGRSLVLQAAPNPTAGETVLRYEAPRPGSLRLEILDAAGRLVRVLRSGPAETGPGAAEWDGRDAGGRKVPAGAYFARVTGTAGRAGITLIVLR